MTATVPNLFGSGTSGTTPQLDADFAALAKCLVIPCTASGTNVVALTPVSSSVAISAYSDKEIYSFTAPNTTTGAVTVNVSGVGALNLYLSDQVTQATTGTLSAGSFYMVAYLAALNSGAGGFVIVNGPTTTTTTVAAKGTFSNLRIANTGSADSQIRVTCSSIILATAGNAYVAINDVNVTPSINVVGANGLDSGSPVSNTFYYPYVIYNGVTVAGLFSLSSGTPSLPAGYTFFSRVGAVLTDGTPKLRRGIQRNQSFRFKVVAGTTSSGVPQIAAGTVGNISTPTYVAATLVSYVPTTAGAVLLTVAYTGANAVVLVAPNQDFGAGGSFSAPVPLAGFGATASNTGIVMTESSSVFWASNAAASLHVAGWEDNL